MNNPVTFKYNLSNPGSASCMLDINGNAVDLNISNASSPITDLLRGMVSMIFEPSHIWGEENVQVIEWYGEEKSYKWIFSTGNGEVAHIKIVEYSDIFDSSTEITRLNEVCSSIDFYSGIVTELDRFIKETGLLNYEQQWQNDEFPLTYFLILKKFLVEKGLWTGTSNKPGILENEMDILFL